MGIEERAGLGYTGEVSMADDLGVGVGFLQVFEQEPEGGFLLGSASVGIAASIVHAANVADANGVLVVVFLLVLEPGWSATLNSDCSQNAGYDGCNEF